MREVAATHYDPIQIEAFLAAATPAIDALLTHGEVWTAAMGRRLVASAAWHFEGALPTLGQAAAPDAQVAVFRAVYVRPGWTRLGLASRLMDKVEAAARSQGAVRARLHAMLGAVAFYERRGYAPVGDTVFDLNGVAFPGVAMTKLLSEAAAEAA